MGICVNAGLLPEVFTLTGIVVLSVEKLMTVPIFVVGEGNWPVDSMISRLGDYV